MKARHIKCPVCKVAPSPKSIDPEFELESLDHGLGIWAVDLECANGHKFIFGMRDVGGEAKNDFLVHA